MQNSHDLIKLKVIDTESLEYLLCRLGKPSIFVDGIDEGESNGAICLGEACEV